MNSILSWRSSAITSSRLVKSSLALTVVICTLSSVCTAQSIYQPAGLNRGDPYRLVFITGGLIEPRSSSLQVYNNFVAAEAALPNSLVRGLNTGWSAIVSNSTTAARTNTNTDPSPAGPNGVPLFLVDGQTRIADNYDDLWDGTIDAPIGLTQFGTAPVGGVAPPNLAWTGTRADGTSYLAFQPFTMGTGSVVAGFGSQTSDYWVSAALIGVGSGDRGGHLYAVSGILTAVPEPASLCLVASSFIVMCAVRRRNC
jgi:hypothetical protein